MSCSEVRSLLALRAFDLLEGEERSSVEGHLSGCAACRLELASSDEVASIVREARADERPSERVWDGIVARLDAAAPAVEESRGTLLQLACASCHGGLDEAVYCASCLAPHHGECFATLGCGVSGCSGRKVVGASAPRRSVASLLLVGIAAVAAIVFVQQAFDERSRDYERLLEESQRNARLEADLRKFLADAKPSAVVKDEVNVRCEDEDLASLLDRIGQQAHQSIVVAPDVKEKVTITLAGARWRDAVAVIASFARCDVFERGSVVVLARPTPAVEAKRIELPPVTHPDLHEEQHAVAPAPEVPGLRFPDGRVVPVSLQGIIDGTKARIPSSAVLNGVGYREGDKLQGPDKRPLVPAVYVARITRDKVELASGSLAGPRAVLAIGH